jgi:hypothetical protein
MTGGRPGRLPEGVVIRRARPSDAFPVAVVHVRSWQAAYQGLVPRQYLGSLDPKERAATWQRRLEEPESPRGPTLVAGTGEHLLGFASVGPTRGEDEGPAASRGGPCDLPDSRGLGQRDRLQAMAAGLDTLLLPGSARPRSGFWIRTCVPGGSTKLAAGPPMAR